MDVETGGGEDGRRKGDVVRDAWARSDARVIRGVDTGASVGTNRWGDTGREASSALVSLCGDGPDEMLDRGCAEEGATDGFGFLGECRLGSYGCIDPCLRLALEIEPGGGL